MLIVNISRSEHAELVHSYHIDTQVKAIRDECESDYLASFSEKFAEECLVNSKHAFVHIPLTSWNGFKFDQEKLLKI